MSPLLPDASLSVIVGTKELHRTQVVKKLWAYIEREGLHDTQNRRMINVDSALKPIFGGKKQVSTFEMTKLGSKHLKPT